MKLRGLTFTVGLVWAGQAQAGGLILPGSGAVSTARAGAGVASAEDGEAISLNPAGIAKAKGTTITIGITAIDYLMQFQRNGNYDDIMEEAQPYEGQRYPVVKNDAKPPLGFGAWQPVPVIAIVSDLGGRVPNLHVGFGIYAPNAYPFRKMRNVNGKPWEFNSDFGDPPPPSRYDIIDQEAAIILPSLVAAYRVTPQLDVGVRGSLGIANVKSTVAIWGVPANYEEWVKADGQFTLDAKETLVPAAALGAAFRPTPQIELGAQYVLPTSVHAKGNATSVNGPSVSLNGAPIVILPVDDVAARCAKGGTTKALKGCVDFQLPMTAQLGGRYKFLDADGKQKGDIELDVDWEHWSADRATNYQVVVDGQVATESNPMNGITLKDNIVAHGLRDTLGLRLGGSWSLPAGANEVIIRGGVGYDTAAAKTGWERSDVDGAARTTIAAGGSYKMKKFRFDAGLGMILEGTRNDPRTCNPTAGVGTMGCAGTPGYTGGTPGVDNAVKDRQGPDPINPIIVPDQQFENPVNAGTYKSHYLLFMLGMSTWF